MNKATITNSYTVKKVEKVIVRKRNKEPQALTAYQSETVLKGEDSSKNVKCNSKKMKRFKKAAILRMLPPPYAAEVML